MEKGKRKKKSDGFEMIVKGDMVSQHVWRRGPEESTNKIWLKRHR